MTGNNNKDEIRMQDTNDMPALKIGIVEDEVVIAQNIAAALEHLGYDVIKPAYNYIDAVSMLTKHKPDLVMLDIMLNDDRDGVDLAKRINDEFHIPFIFLTANADQATVARAKETQPASYLIKPFTRNDLYASVEVANVRHQMNGGSADKQNVVFIKDGNVLRKLVVNEVVRIEAERAYLNIFTHSRQMLLRKSIPQILKELNDPRFVQVHRSHVVNIHHIDTFSGESIEIGNTTVPVSRSNRPKLQEILLKK
jgi:DNA-binding LytR/AlgR family response regulator